MRTRSGFVAAGVVAVSMLASGQAEAGPGVEYVRVCDTYGSGFFYIPGTDTCLRIGGYVRSDTVANGARVSTRPAPAGLSKPWGGPQEMACSLQPGFFYIPGTDQCGRIAGGRIYTTPVASWSPGAASPRSAHAPVFNWSGFYVGVSGGYAWGDTDVTTTRAVSINIVDPLLANNFAQPSQSDAFGAVSFGYDMMYSQRVVLGLEGDVTFGSRNATVHGVPGLVGGFLPAASAQSDRIEVDSDFSASISTRIGYLVTPQLLAYGRVGWAWQNFDVTYHCGSGAGFCGAAPATAPFSVTESHTADGFLLGAGIEWQIVKGVSARAEYRHAFLNDFDVHLGNPATRQISLNVKPNVDEFRAGVVARFSAFGMPPAPPPP